MNDATTTPTTELDARYGGADAAPTPWSTVVGLIEAAELFWISTVRSDGRPHVTPLIAVWVDGALHITTGHDEQKAKNLAATPHCSLTTGTNALHGGSDVVVAGEARRITGAAVLQRVADAFLAKYGAEWTFAVDGDVLRHSGGVAEVFAIAPQAAYCFGKAPYSHTRYIFAR